MSPDFSGRLCYPVFVLIGILTQVNLVQKSAEIFIPFWVLVDLLILELILKTMNGNEKYIVMTAAKEYLPAFNQGLES